MAKTIRIVGRRRKSEKLEKAKKGTISVISRKRRKRGLLNRLFGK